MAVLLQILLETIILTGFLWLGASIMKAQIRFKTIVITAMAGALASQVPFIGTYISFAVVLFFLWKMARVDIIPDGVLILVIGKGIGLIITIYSVALLMDHVDTDPLASHSHIPIYTDDEGKRYYADGELMYYLDDNDEKVFVDADEILGISEIMEIGAEDEVATIEPVETPSEVDPVPDPDESAEIAAIDSPLGFSPPLLSDSVIRGEPLPFELFVPQGWMIKRTVGELAIRNRDHTFFHCYSSPEGSENKTYLRKELQRVSSKYAGYEIANQEVVTLDRQKWARIQMANDEGDQVLLMTHADTKGCYSIELNGSYQQLSEKKGILNRMMFSFNFPPSTYYLAQLESEE